MKRLFPFLIFLGLALTACSENPLKIYKGDWGGTYTGAKDFGRLDFFVDREGALSGSLRSDTLTTGQKNLTGKVDAVGGILVTAEVAGQTYVFEGDLDKNRGSGTWKAQADSSLSGTWRASKF